MGDEEEVGGGLRKHREMRKKWVEDFEQMLNVEDDIDANRNVIRMSLLVEFNEKDKTIEDKREAVNEMKTEKAPRLDGLPMECLVEGDLTVFLLLRRLLNESFDKRAVPMDSGAECNIYNLP